MRETQVQSLAWEDPLEKEMATHSSILAWRMPWTEEPGRLQSLGLQRVGHDWSDQHISPQLWFQITVHDTSFTLENLGPFWKHACNLALRYLKMINQAKLVM